MLQGAKIRYFSGFYLFQQSLICHESRKIYWKPPIFLLFLPLAFFRIMLFSSIVSGKTMHTISSSRAAEILSACKNSTIAVVGDLMLDKYFWGSVSRISPEAPVPVIDLENESLHLGGAANVAGNLQALGINPLLCGVVGEDNSGASLMEILESTGCSTNGIIRLNTRPTTVKTRIIGNNQQMLRVDREVRSPIAAAEADMLVDSLYNCTDLAGIILEDYNKGVMTAELIKKICAIAQAREIPVFVDPKFSHFFDYKGVTLFKPNRKEAQ